VLDFSWFSFRHLSSFVFLIVDSKRYTFHGLFFDRSYFNLLGCLYFLFCRDFVSISTGTSEYALTNEDVGRCLAFVYSPINFEGRSIALFVVEIIRNMFSHHLDF